VRSGVGGLVGFGQVLLQLPQVVVRQHAGMPAVGLGHEVIMGSNASESRRRDGQTAARRPGRAYFQLWMMSMTGSSGSAIEYGDDVIVV
jgi:hypothetical protein